MTYNPDIPQSTDILSASQGQLLINFQQLEAIFDANHYKWDYATTALRGMHRFVTLESQASGPATSSTQGAVYTKTVSAAPQLFWRRASSGTEVQLTYPIDPVASNPGYSFLPGGVLIQWGVVSIASSPTTVTFPKAFSAGPWSIVVTPYNNNGSVGMASENFSTTTFKIYSSATSLSASWIATGPA